MRQTSIRAIIILSAILLSANIVTSETSIQEDLTSPPKIMASIAITEDLYDGFMAMGYIAQTDTPYHLQITLKSQGFYKDPELIREILSCEFQISDSEGNELNSLKILPEGYLRKLNQNNRTQIEVTLNKSQEEGPFRVDVWWVCNYTQTQNGKETLEAEGGNLYIPLYLVSPSSYIDLQNELEQYKEYIKILERQHEEDKKDYDEMYSLNKWALIVAVLSLIIALLEIFRPRLDERRSKLTRELT